MDPGEEGTTRLAVTACPVSLGCRGHGIVPRVPPGWEHLGGLAGLRAAQSPTRPVQNVGAGGQTLNHYADPTTGPVATMGDALQAKIFFITLAVDDLDRSVAFYRDGLGWPTEGIVGQEFHDEVTGADGTIAFFNLDSGLLLGLYERTNLAKDASLPPGPPSSTEFSLGVPAESQAEVDGLLRQVEAAGGTLTAPAHMRPFGVYSGYFTDPDGHLFEIAWNSNE
jgi:uncharacterized protein